MSSRAEDAVTHSENRPMSAPSTGRRVFGWLAFTLTCVFALGAGTFAGYLKRAPFMRSVVGSFLHPKPPQEMFKSDALTILVLGCDEDVTTGGVKVTKLQARSDMMMLARCDFAKGTLAAISIPRDTYYKMPGDKNAHKLNAFHAYGGNPLAKKAVEGLLGIKIDRVVAIDFDAFTQLVDLVGGVDLTVDKNLDYDDNAGKLHIHLKKGPQHMNGYQAMGFVRFRHSDSDLARQLRQHEFLMALKAKVASRPTAIEEVAQMGQRVLGNEFTNDETVSLARFGHDIPRDKVRFGQAVVTEKKHSAFLYLDKKETNKLLVAMGLKSKMANEETVAEKPRRHRKPARNDEE